MDWNKGRESNADILIDLCGGNIFETIERARHYQGIKVTVSLKTLERMAVKKFLSLGFKPDIIAQALDISTERVEYINKRIDSETTDKDAE